MNEANTAALSLRSTKQKAEDLKNAKLDELYDELKVTLEALEKGKLSEIDVLAYAKLSRNLANVLKEKRVSSRTMEQLVVRLYKRFLSAESRITKSRGDFNLGDTSNSREYNESELRLFWCVECIIDAQLLLDEDERSISEKPVRGLTPLLEARVRELKKAEEATIQREMDLILKKNPDRTLVSTFSEQTLGEQNITVKLGGKEISGPKGNITRLIENVIQTPNWVPSYILPFLAVCADEIDAETFVKIRSDVLGVSSFNVENWDYSRTAAIYRGNFVDRERATLYDASYLSGLNNSMVSLRRKNMTEESSNVVFEKIQARLKDTGLSDEIQLFLIEDPEWRPGDRYPRPLPSILAVSTSLVPEQKSERGIGMKLLSGLAVLGTLISTSAFATSGYALNPNFLDAVVLDISKLSTCFPIVIGIFVVDTIHEVAHRIAANSSGLKLALPVPLPSLQVGTFGSITALRSFPISRTALFDFAVSGPVAGGSISLLAIIIGIFLTAQAPPEVLSTFAFVPAVFTKMSFLVGIIASVLDPEMMRVPDSQLMPVHPLFLVGFAGLVASALNFMPIGRLDGGRASMAVLGRRPAYFVSLAALFFLAVASLTQTSGMSISWGLLITLFQRNAEIPIRDEYSEIDNFRVGVYISCIAMAVLILTPFPGGPVL
eukprot:CAMPEP_0178929332 /NCGR_PEP_ID=MMETSP0786-20121207/20512_1 /TAXON_ID=186022 /ORGANISM="Thalassionema frauenfeldii, Strain CCMP 1798" /LENGTH=662 /DNA_ID=CAMNT_0020605519 /DNA_START=544 /DNA_END=2532 /DNA_ORIENTATION=+